MTTESVEQLKAKIRTGGFSDGNEPDTPLRDVTGLVQSIEPHMVQRQGQATGRMWCSFKLTDLEVHKSVAPYEYDTGEIDLPTSDRSGSSWGFICSSVNGIFFPAPDAIWMVEGHRVRFTYQNHFFGFDEKLPDQPASDRMCWTWNGKRGEQAGEEVRPFFVVTEIDGLNSVASLGAGGVGTGAAATKQAAGKITELDDPILLGAIAGKTIEAAVNAAVAIPGVTTNAAMIPKIMGTDGGAGLIGELEKAAKITVGEDGLIVLAEG